MSHDIKARILRLCRQRGAGKTICPSEVARSLAHDEAAWRAAMIEVRAAAAALADEGAIVVSKRGAIVDAESVRGPIRLGLPSYDQQRTAQESHMSPAVRIIDDVAREDLMATVGSQWRLVTDRVMGGVSSGTLVREVVAGRSALRMRGDVSLENDGGFVQMALDLAPDGGLVDAIGWQGMELDVLGPEEAYGAHLRTDAMVRPWQSYRQSFQALPEWRTVRLPFADFVPHRIDVPLDIRRLRRIGLVAIGRVFAADLALAGVRFFRSDLEPT